MDPRTESLVTTLTVGIIVGTLLMGILWIFRTNPIYCPRLHRKAIDGDIKNWMSLSDEETLKRVGLDAFILLRFIRLFIAIGLFTTFFGLVILVSIYQYGISPPGTEGINRFTLAHVRQNGGRLWAVLLFYYIYTIAFLALLSQEYKEFARLRQRQFLQIEADGAKQELYSIKVENIPSEHSTSTSLKRLFEHIFPEQVHSAMIAATLNRLNPILTRRNRVLFKLEKVIAKLENLEPSDKDRGLSTGLVEADPKVKKLLTMKYDLRRELDRLNAEVLALEEEARNIQNASAHSSTGFVTFLSLRTYRAALQPYLFDLYPSLTVTAAKSPTDIIWDNVRYARGFILRQCNRQKIRLVFPSQRWRGHRLRSRPTTSSAYSSGQPS